MHHRFRDLFMESLVAVIQALLTLHYMPAIPCNEMFDQELIRQKSRF